MEDVTLIQAAAQEFSDLGGIPGWVIEDMIALAEDRPTRVNYTPDQEEILLRGCSDLYGYEIRQAAEDGFGIGLVVNWDAQLPT